MAHVPVVGDDALVKSTGLFLFSWFQPKFADGRLQVGAVGVGAVVAGGIVVIGEGVGNGVAVGTGVAVGLGVAVALGGTVGVIPPLVVATMSAAADELKATLVPPK